MGLLFSLLAFASFVSAGLVTYRIWRQQKLRDRWLLRGSVATTVLIAVFLFHGMLRQIMPPTAAPRAAGRRSASMAGREAMDKLGCGDCHSIGKGVLVGPDLRLAAAKYDHYTLVQWIEDPQSIYAARHRHPLNDGFPEMPGLQITAEEAEAIATYLDQVATAPH